MLVSLANIAATILNGRVTKTVSATAASDSIRIPGRSLTGNPNQIVVPFTYRFSNVILHFGSWLWNKGLLKYPYPDFFCDVTYVDPDGNYVLCVPIMKEDSETGIIGQKQPIGFLMRQWMLETNRTRVDLEVASLTLHDLTEYVWATYPVISIYNPSIYPCGTPCRTIPITSKTITLTGVEFGNSTDRSEISVQLSDGSCEVTRANHTEIVCTMTIPFSKTGPLRAIVWRGSPPTIFQSWMISFLAK